MAKRPEDISICIACDVPWHSSYSGRAPWRRYAISYSPAPGGGRRKREAAGYRKVLTVPVTVHTLPGAYADMVLPDQAEVGQLVGEPSSVEVVQARVQFVISRVRPFDAGNDAPVFRREAILHMPQGNGVRLLGRGSGELRIHQNA